MKLNNVNLNILFTLGSESEMKAQVDSLARAISLLSNSGIEVAAVKSNAAAPARVTMGSNERLFLRLSGQQRMRTNGTDDREAFAAELVRERYPMNVSELVFESAAAPVIAHVAADDTAEEIDGDELI